MLQYLHISNFALINELKLDLQSGLSILTGETGAGKSIIIGALRLVLGDRADLKSLGNQEKKCVVEVEFNLQNKNLSQDFERLDLDYDENTIVRREILPSGKSRAFINDSPVNLTTLREIVLQLIDVHGQHQTLNINEKVFQYTVLDAYAGITHEVEAYQKQFKAYQTKEKQLEDLISNNRKAIEEKDYLEFQRSELSELNLSEEDADLEDRVNLIDNSEKISESLGAIHQILQDEQGVLSLLNSGKKPLEGITSFNQSFENLLERVNSTSIELEDISNEVEKLQEGIEYNPQEAAALKSRLDQIFRLSQKHRAQNIEELIQVREAIQNKLNSFNQQGEDMTLLEQEIATLKHRLQHEAENLMKKRMEAAPKMSELIERQLKDLGIPNAKFKINTSKEENLNRWGSDQVNFLFSANLGGQPQEVGKVASGGELSRVMLSLKAILSSKMNLPTLIFDEIDTGVSGEIAFKMGEMMQNISNHSQVISITHLPQIAAKGDQHYKVIKVTEGNATATQITTLSKDEQINEVARMLSGEHLTDAALNNARELMKL